jgi:hypothetical protein
MGKSRGRSRISRPGKGTKAPKGAKKSKKARLPQKPKAPVVESAIPAVCTECFGDFNLSTKIDKDRVTCPVCGHVGLIEEGTFDEISHQRENHKKNFIIATVVTCLSFFLILLYGLLNSWPFAAKLAPDGTWGVVPGDETVNMILLGLGLVLLLVGFFVIVRYERSRVEVYF